MLFSAKKVSSAPGALVSFSERAALSEDGKDAFPTVGTMLPHLVWESPSTIVGT